MGDIKDDYIRLIHEPQFDVLPDDEIRKLIDKAQDGCEESKQKVVYANLRLVVQIIKQRVGCPKSLWMDCVSEGNLVLCNCVDTYKTDSNSKFSSHISLLIRWRLWTFVSYHRYGVRIPDSRQKKVEGEEPPPTNYMVPIVYGNEIPFQLEDSKALKGLMKEDRKKLILHCLKDLTETERTVVVHRWLGEDKKSLNDISKMTGKTREGVRIIQNKAFKKIRLAIWKQENQEKNAWKQFDILNK